MPLINQTFSQLITFTRASSATYVDARGLIQSASTNVPRFDYNPSTLAPRGVLIEEQRTNLFTYSEQFDNAAWIKTDLNTTGTPAWVNVATAPDGTSTADKLIANNVNGKHVLFRIQGTTALTTHTMSIFAKASEYGFLALSFIQSSNSAGALYVFNLVDGTYAQRSFAGTFVNVSASSQSFGNGWWRCSITFTNAVGGIADYFIAAPSPSSNPTVDWLYRTASYTGDNTSGIFSWGAQLEAGSFATSYIPTVASQVTRAADLASLNTLSSWFNATEGTLFANYDQNSSTQSGGGLFGQSDGTNNNRILLTADGASSGTIQPGLYVTDASVAQVAIVAGTGTINSTNKLAAAYKVNDFAASFNGAASVTDAVGTVPFVDRSYIGAGATGTSGFINGHIRRIVFYPSRLSNANLQTITA